MQSRVYTPTYCGGTSFTVSNLGIPTGADGYLECATTANDGKYIKYILTTPPYATASSGFYITYDGAIPDGAFFDSVSLTARYAGTLPGADAIYVALWNVPGDETPVALAPISTKSTDDAITFQTDTVSIYDAALAPLELWRLYSRYGFSFNIDYYPGEKFYLDNFLVTINFVLPAPIVFGSLTIDASRVHDIVLHGLIDPRGGASATYPVASWFEWVASDPNSTTVSEASIGVGQIHRTPTQLITTNTSGTSRWTTITAQIPTPFAPLDPTKRLKANTQYWVRLVATNADNTTYGNWQSFTTEAYDKVLL